MQKKEAASVRTYCRSIAMANSTLFLRIFTLLALLASLATLVTNNFSFGETNRTFDNVTVYRYVFSTALMGAAYSLVQIPFAIYHVCKGRRMIRGEYLQKFDFYADKVMSNLLAAGVGAGFAYSVEFKRFLSSLLGRLVVLGVAGTDELKSKTSRFLDLGTVASSLLLVGFICMAVQSVISSDKRSTSEWE